MKVSQLTTKLAAMFPGSFSSPAGAAAWAEVYQKALAPYEGRTLQAAYDDLIQTWPHGYAPKPAEFAAKCNQFFRYNTPESGLKRREIADKLRPLKTVMAADWWYQNAEQVDDFLGKLPDREMTARFWLSQEINDKAHLAAQQRIIRGHGEIEFTSADWGHLIGQIKTRANLELDKDRHFKALGAKYLRDGPPPQETRAWMAGRDE